MSNPKVLFIESCDFETFPAGGQLSVARSLAKFFGGSLALVGMSTGDEPLGQWVKKEIGGTPFWFLAVCRRCVSAERPRVPGRLTFYLGLQRYRRVVMSMGCRYAFTQAPEVLLAVSFWGLDSLCYMFPGVENPLRISRYRLARRLGPVFDTVLFRALNQVDVVLACADENAIVRFVSSSKGRIVRERISRIGTCVDLSEFCPASIRQARETLAIPVPVRVFVTSGRIAKFKGWPLLLDAFEIFLRKRPESLMVFVGDGEDRQLLEAAVAQRGLNAFVRVTGFQSPNSVSRYINAANVFLCGSLAEGFSVAMLEALACGKPIVTTPVSGTSEMIRDGRNGFVVETRDPEEYALAMEKALGLKNAADVSLAIAGHFGLAKLGERLSKLWFPFALCAPAADPTPLLHPSLSETGPGFVG